MKIINDGNYPYPFMDALQNNDYDFRPDEWSISVTQLIDSPLIRRLRLEHDDEIVVNASDMVWSIRGQAMHYVMERAGSEYIKELRLNQTFNLNNNPILLSGKLDLLDINNMTLWDYKDTSVWKYIYNPNGDVKWSQQTNILAYLLRKHGIYVKEIKILMFLRDWKETDYIQKKDSGYPPKEVMVMNIKLLEDEIVERFIAERLRHHFDTDVHVCSEEDRWAKPEQYAITKEGQKRAYRVFDAETDANAHFNAMPNKDLYYIQKRPGEDVRCLKRGYCNVKRWCNYYNKNYGGEVL